MYVWAYNIEKYCLKGLKAIRLTFHSGVTDNILKSFKFQKQNC